MSNKSFDQAADGRLLHDRLLRDDPTTSHDLLEAYLPLLQTHLKIHYPEVDSDLIADAVTEACLNYIERPRTYDPVKCSLLTYLKMSADSDLKNALARIQRERRHLVPLAAVELSEISGNSNVEEEVINRQEALERLRNWQITQSRLNNQAADNEQDRQLLELLQVCVRRTAEYAAVLGIQHLPVAEQRRIVKQHKDRLTKRLQRLPAAQSEPKIL